MANNDDEEGFTKFEVSDWDMEFGTGNFKPKRMSKNQAIYGIWAESESDDDDTDKRKKKKTDYTTGVNFVKSDKKLDEETKQMASGDDAKSKPSKNQKTQRFGLGHGGMMKDAGFGQWEMYTKGVGSKLLQKMGYQPGRGLGKNLQGIIEPVEAKKRPGTGSIGMYGPESTTRKPRRGDEIEKRDLDQEDRSSIKESKGVEWKKTDKQKKAQTVKVYTKSTDEIIKESIDRSWNSQESGLSGVQIIDMTGPEQRVLTGLTQLHQSKAQRPKGDYEVTPFNTRFNIPELKLNIERHVMLSEKSLLNRKRDHDRNSTHIENLTEEKERLDQLLKVQNEQLQNLQLFSTFVESLEDFDEKNNSNKITFEEALKKFEDFFNEDRRKQLKSLKVDNLIISTFNGILRRELRTWRPFDNFAFDYSHLFQRLKKMVMKNRTYEILLWDHWNPHVCRALQSWPSMKNPEPIISFIEKWRPILPKWMYEYFVANNLIPHIKNEVEIWNPLTDNVPIHSWIHPWLPVLLVVDDGRELNFLFEPIYEIIRMKLANALTNWHPGDSSARLILQPWKNVFNEASLQTFLDVNIVPKLEQAIQSMSINPSQQSVNEWNWVMSWKSLLSLNTIVSILERHFFSKWLNVLYVWLNSGMANENEISLWYQGWKGLMGEDLVHHPSVKDLLKKALIMMDDAANAENGLMRFTSYYNQPTGAVSQPAVIPTVPETTQEDQQRIDASATMSFRQMVEMKAAENGILFMPIANRFEGVSRRQVFKFGSYLIYFDNQVIFQKKYHQGKWSWMPIRLDDLVQQASD